MDYRDKYIKYKLKYYKLNKLKGGFGYFSTNNNNNNNNSNTGSTLTSNLPRFTNVIIDKDNDAQDIINDILHTLNENISEYNKDGENKIKLKYICQDTSISKAINRAKTIKQYLLEKKLEKSTPSSEEYKKIQDNIIKFDYIIHNILNTCNDAESSLYQKCFQNKADITKN
jgi:hypothetical protein